MTERSNYRQYLLGAWIVMLAVALLAMPHQRADGAEKGKIYPSAEETKALKSGKLPKVDVQTLEGETVGLRKLLNGKRSVLVFYRGGWCPYCTKHLEGLKDAEEALTKLGYQVIAISPDNPDHLKESLRDHELSYTLLSDSKVEAAKAFGIAFQVDDDTLKKYKDYSIDLVAASGEDHNVLPVPAVFIVNPRGMIVYSHADPDYTKRLSNEDLINAAKKAKRTEGS